jgi:hypothetical protein
MDLWRRSARISRKDKIRNSNVKQTVNVTRSALDGIKTKQLQWCGQVQRVEEGRLPKGVMKWRPAGRRERGRPKLKWVEGIRGMVGEKGIGGRRLEQQTQLEEEGDIINKWVQENVNRLYSLLNDNNDNNSNNNNNLMKHLFHGSHVPY